MRPSEFYQSLLAQIDDKFEQDVFQCLAGHIGESISRQELIFDVCGAMVDKEILSGDADDRRIRKCIERLRYKGFPIVSSSSGNGYSLVDDPQKMDTYLAEERARADHIQKKIQALYRARRMARAMPMIRKWKASEAVATQDRFL